MSIYSANHSRHVESTALPELRKGIDTFQVSSRDP